MIPDRNSCTRFWLCDRDRRFHVRTCPNQQIFDHEIRRCVQRGRGRCWAEQPGNRAFVNSTLTDEIDVPKTDYGTDEQSIDLEELGEINVDEYDPMENPQT